MTGRLRGTFRLGGGAAAVVTVLALLAAPTHAAPTPAPTPTPATTPTPAPVTPATTGTPTPSGSPTPDGSPSASPSPTPTTSSPSASTPTAGAEPQAEQAPGLTLAVRSTFGNGSSYWSDIGRYAFRGSAGGLEDGATVAIYFRTGGSGWRSLTRGRAEDGRFAVDQPVGGGGTFTFVATSGGAPGGDVATSNTVTVTVGDARVVLDRPVLRIDALRDPRLTGRVVPGRSGVTVNVDVLNGGRFVKVAQTRTDRRGRFALTFRHGHGRLKGYRVRAAYRTPNRGRWETAPSHRLVRVAVLNAVVSPTTAAEVAKTYRGGCPVGPSRLRTITMTYYGADGRVHRGVMIVRTDLVGEVTTAFGRALQARFPIARMRNPNAYGGNDPRQMRADNSSGFNCRSVVGNPYRRSPHSYGIAIDVNPRQNPYRDVSGKWWPENGVGYIDRTPRRGGMLDSRSTLVRALDAEGFFWGGRWSPGRDYQHFQYR